MWALPRKSIPYLQGKVLNFEQLNQNQFAICSFSVIRQSLLLQLRYS